MPERKRWSREELIVAFSLYCRIPFGQLHRSNAEVRKLATVLGRSPNSVAMKLVNFASLDPYHKARGVSGLKHVSRADRNVWDEFHSDWESLAAESHAAQLRFEAELQARDTRGPSDSAVPSKTEVVGKTRVRLVQGFFRDSVLAAYDYECAICRLSLPGLLNAGHIIPWNKCESRRADPTNGISFCVLHDRAFDRGLFTIDGDYRIILNRRVRVQSQSILQEVALRKIEGSSLTLPSRFYPDRVALTYHRENIFIAE